MIVMSLEEFATGRRASQGRLENALRAAVERALDGGVNSQGYGELMDLVRQEWSDAYSEESGQPRSMPQALIAVFLRTLRKTDQASSDDSTIERITAWLATAILSSSTVQAAQDDPEEIFLQWVDMNDAKVRTSHAEASGQTRPLGEDFKVGNVEMPYPGYPGVVIEEWISCRCTVRQVLASEALVASILDDDLAAAIEHVKGMNLNEVTYSFGQMPEPTHAGIAIIAADTGRLLMMQRSMDPTDDVDVQGTWEFPGGRIEEGEGPEEAAWREWHEETGLTHPEGEMTNGWRSDDGVYQGFVYTVPVEQDAFEFINPEQAETQNPDDPDRSNPEVTAWFTIEQIKNLGPALRPAVAKMDWSVFDRPEDQENTMPKDEIATEVAAAEMPPAEPDECLERDEDGNCIDPPDADDEKAPPFAAEERVPWHGVLAPEGVWSGDRRRFREGSLSNRPLPLPITWQKVSDDGHRGNVVVAVCDRIAVVEGEQRGTGWMLSTAEADEVMGLVAEFGRFGISVDADSATTEMNEEEEGMDFTAARTSSACLVAIPAFAEAWFALGEAPEGFLPDEDAETLPDDADLDEEVASLVASFADAAPGITQDGPGWLTHPVPTDRLRDYWVRGPGAAKIGWGVPGDWRRCKVALSEYVKPQFINGYCANRHFDALGFWPGQETAADLGTSTDTPAVTLVASTGRLSFSHTWFKDPEFKVGDERMIRDSEGNWACPATVTEDGRVFGHVAGWKTCHGNWAEGGICVTAPHSATQYAHFLTGQVETDIGAIPVGALTVGGGHAPDGLRARAAAAHYDSTSTVWAYVNVGEDEYGIWFSGILKPGLSQDKLVEALAAPLSGDWRLRGAALEMIAAHSVVTPGFSIPRVACGIEDGEQVSLVAAGVLTPRADDTDNMREMVRLAVEEGFAQARARRTQMRSITESLEAHTKIVDIFAEIERLA